jgi:hypothetical protein
MFISYDPDTACYVFYIVMITLGATQIDRASEEPSPKHNNPPNKPKMKQTTSKPIDPRLLISDPVDLPPWPDQRPQQQRREEDDHLTAR